MKLLKTKTQAQAKPEETPVSLAERIEQIRAETEAFIESKVAELKASPEGRLLPIDWLRADLRRRTGGDCNCKCVSAILEQGL